MISLHPAGPDDSVSAFEWRNDETTRAASISQDPVPWDDHERWYAAMLSNPSRYLYIAMAEGERVGLCRFDVDGAAAEVSINLAPAARGGGLAGPILRAGIERLREAAGAHLTLTATIRPDNVASVRTFTALGFVPSSSAAGLDHYVLEPGNA